MKFAHKENNSTNCKTLKSGALSIPTELHAQTVMNGETYIFGGSSTPNDVLKFDENSKKFLQVGQMVSPREGASECVKMNHRIAFAEAPIL